jgi:glycosyltransferase involved in cell wall biosynthesis
VNRADSVRVPIISVIVPVYEQWDLVPGLLQDLGAQSLPPDRFEVVIADNKAPDPPPSLQLPHNARIVPASGPGSYAARNAGAIAARGSLLVFTDADCRPDPGWLAALVAASAAAPGALLAGPVRMAVPTTPNAFALYDLVRGIPQARYVSRGYAATANLAVPAAVFSALGGFDPGRRSGGDAAFCRRAGAAGHSLRLVPEAAVSHPCRSNWEALARKAKRIKGGQIAVGPLSRRFAWGLRTLCPPVTDTCAFLSAPHPWRHRLIAVAVRFRLWGIEITETVRLMLGCTPERR